MRYAEVKASSVLWEAPSAVAPRDEAVLRELSARSFLEFVLTDGTVFPVRLEAELAAVPEGRFVALDRTHHPEVVSFLTSFHAKRGRALNAVQQGVLYESVRRRLQLLDADPEGHAGSRESVHMLHHLRRYIEMGEWVDRVLDASDDMGEWDDRSLLLGRGEEGDAVATAEAPVTSCTTRRGFAATARPAAAAAEGSSSP